MTGGPPSGAFADLLRSTLDRPPRRTVGLAAGVLAGDATAVRGLGTTGTGASAPTGDTLFQIGSVTKVFTASRSPTPSSAASCPSTPRSHR